MSDNKYLMLIFRKIRKIKIFQPWKLYIGLPFLLLLFLAGYFFSKQSWDGKVFVYLDNNTYSHSNNFRNIASVEKRMNLSSLVLEGGELTQESQKALLNSSRVGNQGDKIQFYLGHFLVKSKKGGSVLACQEYKKVDMTFIAPGISSHGHVPKMTLQADCHFDLEQPLQIGPFYIPKKRILGSSVNRELFKSEEGILLFSHVSIRWPRKWILDQVRFINDKDEDFTVSFHSNKEEDFLTLSLN